MFCSIYHVNKDKWFQVFLYITNNSVKHQSFVYKRLNVKTVLFLKIQFSRSHLFALRVIVKKFSLIYIYDPIRCYHSRLEWTREWWQRRGIPHSPKLQHYLSLTIIYSLMSYLGIRWGGINSLQRCSQCILQLPPTGVLLGWFVGLEVSGRTFAVLLGSASRFVENTTQVRTNAKVFEREVFLILNLYSC